jgi:hypothetical protein
MEVWHFTEMPYPDVPANGPRAVTLGSGLFDPEIGRQLYQRYFDEYMLADDLGFNVMLNEHHATAGCINVAGPLSCAILARQTKNARILLLGNPIANRSDPCKIASNIDPIPKASQRIDLVVKDYDLGGRVTRPIVTPLKMTIPQLYQ